MFDASLFWPALNAVGMLSVATDADGDFNVGFSSPDRFMDVARTTDYQIEYQHADRPSLAVDDQVSIVNAAGDALGTFKVREKPYIEGDGYFRKVLLTKIA